MTQTEPAKHKITKIDWSPGLVYTYQDKCNIGNVIECEADVIVETYETILKINYSSRVN